MKDYHINIFYSEEDEGYIADIPDLRHCSAFGTTPEAGAARSRNSEERMASSARANNMSIPEPRYRPIIYQVAEFVSPELLEKYEPVIGLEVHAQMLTRSKAFCSCSTEFGALPNTTPARFASDIPAHCPC